MAEVRRTRSLQESDSPVLDFLVGQKADGVSTSPVLLSYGLAMLFLTTNIPQLFRYPMFSRHHLVWTSMAVLINVLCALAIVGTITGRFPRATLYVGLGWALAFSRVLLVYLAPNLVPEEFRK